MWLRAFADRPGDWRVSIIGSQANDRWAMRIFGPNAFERSYTLEGSSVEHRQEMIRAVVGQLLRLRTEECRAKQDAHPAVVACRDLPSVRQCRPQHRTPI